MISSCIVSMYIFWVLGWNLPVGLGLSAWRLHVLPVGFLRLGFIGESKVAIGVEVNVSDC